MQIGDYRVEAELARGGMGVVYRARDPEGTQVALKVLTNAGAADPELHVRFRREAEALAALDHPGILRVRDYGVGDGGPYLVADLLEGETLEARVKGSGPLPEREAAEMGRQVAAALGHAHERGLLHRDVKPANVILEGGRPVLIDFGLTRDLASDASRLTESGTILGSVHYMAPEQALAQGELGPAADLYALGATLYFLLTGAPPFAGVTTIETLQQVAHAQPVAPRKLRPELSPELEGVVLRCLEKDPSRRYPSAFALEQALESYPHAEPAPSGSRQRGALSQWIAAGALALTVLGVAALQGQERGPSPPSSLLAQPPVQRDEAHDPNPGEVAQDPSREVNEQTAVKIEALKRINVLLKRREYEAALERCDRLLESAPDDMVYRALRGEALLFLRRYAAASDELDRVLGGGGLSPALAARPFALRGICRTRLGDHERALEDYARAFAGTTPLEPIAYLECGRSYAALGRHHSALPHFDRALGEVQDPDWYGHRAKSLTKLGRLEEAVEDLEQALRLDPGRVGDWNDRGVLLRRQDEFATAIECFSAALLLDPDLVSSLRGRAYCFLRVGRHEESLTDYRRAARLDPSATSWAGCGRNLVALERYVEAVEAFDRALEFELASARRSNYLARRAVAKANLERYEEAIEDYDLSLALQPGVALRHYNRALSESKLRRDAEALRDLERALALGLEGEVRAHARRLRAEIRNRRR